MDRDGLGGEQLLSHRPSSCRVQSRCPSHWHFPPQLHCSNLLQTITTLQNYCLKIDSILILLLKKKGKGKKRADNSGHLSHSFHCLLSLVSLVETRDIVSVGECHIFEGLRGLQGLEKQKSISIGFNNVQHPICASIIPPPSQPI